MKINIEVCEGKKFDTEKVKKYVKPFFWFGAFRCVNGAVNNICRPTRNIGFIFNAIVSGEVATLLTAMVFKKDEEETRVKDDLGEREEVKETAETDDGTKDWKEVEEVIKNADTVGSAE